jgi:hypothetical protein
MAKTAAQRQAAYRAQRPFAGSTGNGERRLSIWIDTSTELAITRLARRYAVTKRQIIERLVLAEDNRILSSIDSDTPEWDAYLNPSALRSNGMKDE